MFIVYVTLIQTVEVVNEKCIQNAFNIECHLIIDSCVFD